MYATSWGKGLQLRNEKFFSVENTLFWLVRIRIGRDLDAIRTRLNDLNPPDLDPQQWVVIKAYRYCTYLSPPPRNPRGKKGSPNVGSPKNL
jgi:hypothetical protein